MSVRTTVPFAVVPEWVLDADIGAVAVRLYALLARYADAEGSSYPSRRKLAERMRCSVDTVDRAVKELEGIGAVEVQRRQRADRTWSSNGYLLRPDAVPDERLHGRTDAARGGGMDAAGDGRTDAAPKNESQLEREPVERDSSELAARKPAPRPRDPVFDAIATVCQIGEHPTKSEASQIGKAKRELLAAWVSEHGEGPPEDRGLVLTPAEVEYFTAAILERGREAWRRWEHRPFSPMALSKHWSSLATPATSSNGNGRGPKYGVTDAWDDLRATIEGGTGNDAGRMAGDLRAPVLGVPVEQRDEGEPRRLLHGSGG